jgi:cytidylate kinase
MQIVCISRGTHVGGKELAERLAEKLDYKCLSREELLDAATKEGIQIGKLEMAMVRPGSFTERLALEREYFLAFVTDYLCDRAMESSLVYHGRTGHLLLSGVSHVLRVRAVADMEYRINATMMRLGVDRQKARRYLTEVEDDIRRWVHTLYGISWEDAAHYDFIVNLSQMNPGNAAATLVSAAQLSDFQMTPASLKAMLNLRLAAKARILLARDERTWKASFKVRADNGVVTVTYLPQDAKLADAIPAVLEPLEGIEDIRKTMATTNILWIQELFDPGSETFKEVVEIATKWQAAVQLIRLDLENGAEDRAPASEESDSQSITAPASETRIYDGGIEDDVEEAEICEDGGMTDTVKELAKLGCSGGGRLVCGDRQDLLNALERDVPYTLIVIGDILLSRAHAARLRMARELRSFMNEHIKAPAVTTDELKEQYLFGRHDLYRLIGFAALVAVIYFLVFNYQEGVLSFLIGTSWKTKAIAATAVFLFVPLVAFLYGNVAKSFLKLIKIE